MNLMDIITIAVILLSAFIGYKRGLVKTAFGFVSFFVAIGVALLFYKPLALILTEKTTIDDWIIEKIENTQSVSGDIEKLDKEVASEEEIEAQENTIIENSLSDLPSVVIEKFNLEEIKNNAKHEIAIKVSELIMKLLSLIIIYLVVKITLFVAGLLLNSLMNLPVLKQVNEILGLIIGTLIGFLEIYTAFAVLTFISSIANISFIIDPIKASFFASMLFENNLLIKLLF